MQRDTPSAENLRRFLERYESAWPVRDEAQALVMAFAQDLVKDEREACAVLAEHGGISKDRDIGKQIAALIRTRSKI